MATVTKRGNSYLIRASVGYTVDGKQVRPSMTWKPEPGITERQIQKELDRQMVLFEESCHGAVRGDGHIKFQRFSDEWMKEYGEAALGVLTQASYRRVLKRANAFFGHLYVDSITPRQIQAFINELREPGGNLHSPEQGLSPRSLRGYLSVLSSLFQYAVKMEMIERNPCRIVTMPPTEGGGKGKKCYTLEEAQAFLDALQEAPLKWQTFFALALFGGYRREELLGFEFEEHTVTVRRASVYSVGNGMITVPTKTAKSSRTLKLPARIFNLAHRLQMEQIENHLKYGDQWHECGRLFTKHDGSPMAASVPYSWLQDFCKKKNLPFYGIHQFRHLNASLMIYNGEDVRTVSSMLGHSRTSTTLDFTPTLLKPRRQEQAKLLRRNCP